MEYTPLNRRKFIASTTKVAGGLTLIKMPGFNWAGAFARAPYTVQQIIDLILKDAGLSLIPNTVDTLKSGSADAVVTGIVTTMFATVTVIEQAVKLNANFIIAHEPTFYNHTDNKEWVKNNSVVKQKLALLDKHRITVWRFHDYIHTMKPDYVVYGVMKKTGWLSYFQTGKFVFDIPSVTLQQLVAHLKSSLNIPHLRVIGDLQQGCRKIAFLPGAPGGQWHVTLVEAEKPDVLIIGEAPEWETTEYIRDSNLLGGKTALIILGHGFSEDPGMDAFADWLQPKLPGIKVTHIASGDPFMWL